MATRQFTLPEAIVESQATIEIFGEVFSGLTTEISHVELASAICQLWDVKKSATGASKAKPEAALVPLMESTSRIEAENPGHFDQ